MPLLETRLLDNEVDQEESSGTEQPAQQQEPVAKRLDLLERGRILAANQRDLDLTAGKTVAKMLNDLCDHILELYTSPPSLSLAQRQARSANTWAGLTQQDIDIAFDDTREGGGFDDFARAIEAKLKEKNA